MIDSADIELVFGLVWCSIVSIVQLFMILAMTEWNPNDPFDLGVWENLGLPPPLPGSRPEGYTPPKLPIPPVLDPQDLCRSPEAKKAR